MDIKNMLILNGCHIIAPRSTGLPKKNTPLLFTLPQKVKEILLLNNMHFIQQCLT